MWILLISILAALVIAMVANKLFAGDKSGGDSVTEASAQTDCCGAHEICDKESLIPHASDDIIYYSDEELDLYKGKAPDQYTTNEIEQFQEVLLTMHSQEVSGWLRSLMLRGIKLPSDVREDALSIIKKQRA
jgi:hypothetical protein